MLIIGNLTVWKQYTVTKIIYLYGDSILSQK